MRTLVIGCGYVGTQVAQALRTRGERVFATTRSIARADALAVLGIEPIVVDVLAPDGLRTLSAMDRTLYCVGFDRSTGIPMATVYLDGLRQALEAAGARLGRFVYTSTTGVFGQTDGAWVDEDSETRPTEPSGRTCLDAERLALEWGASQQVAVTIVRFSGLYGPGRIIRRDALLRGDPIGGDPDHYLNLIHRDDAAHAAILALDRGEPGRLYLATDDQPIRRRAYYESTAQCLGAAPPRFEPASTITAPAVHRRVSNRRIRRELGFVPTYPCIATGLPASLAEERRNTLDQPPAAGSM